MITPKFVQTMARYNAWQNKQLCAAVDRLDQAALDLNRGAFFGSIQKTLSHLLWGDTLWLSRFDAGFAALDCSGQEGLTLWSSKSDWIAARQMCDAQITTWAKGLTQARLDADLTWTYVLEDKQDTKPLGFCITHFFNHQTHHRGQVHAMLTAAGQNAPVSDLSYLPENL